MTNDFQQALLLRIRCELEQLVTEREGMIAANQMRADQGLAQAYGQDAFENLATRIGLTAPDPRQFS